MIIRADRARCHGHQMCAAALPELFDADDEGLVLLEGDGVVPPELGAQARFAVRNCPERALTVEE